MSTNMTPLQLISTLVTTYLCFAAGQSPCSTPNGKSGNCVPINKCKSLAKLTSDLSQDNIKLLRSSYCGYEGSMPKVCCPKNTCTTPDGAEGTCVKIQSCPHLANMLKNPLITQDTIQYLRRSRCIGTERYSVCCGSQLQSKSGVSAPNPSPSGVGGNNKCQLTAFPPEPSSNCCGLDASNGGNRIFGGNITAVDEYPWLAIVEYKKDNKIKLLCGGVLISGRYVLTAGHCIVGPVLNAGRPVNVRLGEYDTSNPGEDCVDVDGGGEDCTDGALTVPIEKATPHPEYNPSSKLRRHDIALLRLVQIVSFTDFIRPICLPSTDFTTSPPPNTMLFTAGWGAVDENTPSSNIKQKVGLPYVSYQGCQPSYNTRSRKVQLWGGQICAGGVSGQDSCKGDSGGPLMRENGGMFELVGIVSFGPTPCGTENVAGVYTKVFHYLPWIRSQIVA